MQVLYSAESLDCHRYDVKALTYCDLKAINVEILVEVKLS